MKKKLFMFFTPEGRTYSSEDEIFPDVDDLQILGYGEGSDVNEAFEDFLSKNKWVLNTNFNQVNVVEIAAKLDSVFFLEKYKQTHKKDSIYSS